MTDDDRLQAAISRAARARALLENELLAEAFDTLDKAYIEAWRTTLIGDDAAREKLFLAVNIAGKVRGHLQSIVSNGSLAQREIEELVKLAERKKRFGLG